MVLERAPSQVATQPGQPMLMSTWAEQTLKLSDGRPVNFDGRAFARGLVDTVSAKAVWQTSRQVGKTVQALIRHLFYMANYRDYGVLYVVPEYRQAREFSIDRLDKMVKDSPLLSFMHTGEDNLAAKGFGNGSHIKLRWVGHNLDGTRGLTEYSTLHIDEAQGIDLEATLPVLMQIIFAATGPRRRLISGTPKSNENGLTRVHFAESDQREWVVACRHHTPVKWIELERRNIGLKGPICHMCGNLLNTDDGCWVPMNPNPPDALPHELRPPGFHVHQMCSRNESHATPERWQEWVRELHEYNDDEADNEVFGWAADVAEIPIPEGKLIAACTDVAMTTEPVGEHFRSDRVAGIDWGQGQAATCLVVVQKLHDIYYVRFMRKWTGSQTYSAICLPEMSADLKRWSVSSVHADFGAGYDNNYELARRFSNVTQNIWSDSAIAADGHVHKDLDPMAITMNKTKAMDHVLKLLDRGKIKFPRWSDVAPFKEFFTNVRRESDKKTDKVRYVKAGIDDMWQALCYAVIRCELQARMNAVI